MILCFLFIVLCEKLDANIHQKSGCAHKEQAGQRKPCFGRRALALARLGERANAHAHVEGCRAQCNVG